MFKLGFVSFVPVPSDRYVVIMSIRKYKITILAIIPIFFGKADGDKIFIFFDFRHETTFKILILKLKFP